MKFQHLSAAQQDPGSCIDLRIMATTDLHMHVLGYDYFADRPSHRIGLSRVATLIETARREAANCLLFDNGDSLQGNPMGDYLADAGQVGPKQRHPMIAAMNALGYDAVTIGNHDFSYGLRFLRQTLEGADFPTVATNLTSRRRLPVRRELLLIRRLHDRDGRPHDLRIGVLGFLPPQTVKWEPELSDDITVADILDAAHRGVAALQAQRADLIIALSHSGIGSIAAQPMMENAAAALADLPGIDAVIAGHTHRIFPAPDHPASDGVDAMAGTLAGKPAVMPGFWGSHLGVIDLALEPSATPGRAWQVAGFASRAMAIKDLSPEHSLVTRPTIAAHQGTLRHFRRRVGRSQAALSSYFTLIGNDPGLRLVAMAQRWHVRKALQGSAWQDLPILSAAAPFRAGGRGGPDHYTDVPAGRLTLRSLADLYLFPNRICALLLDGAGVSDWLERSASQFLQIQPDLQDQPLIDLEFPSYNFDLIEGLDWQLDLSQPPRHAPDGRLLNASATRVTDLHYRGVPVRPDQKFILATNSYRLSDSGPFAPVVAGRQVIMDNAARTRDVLRRYVAQRRVITPDGNLGWRFRALPGASVLFQTGPGAAAQIGRLWPGIESLGIGSDGFLSLRLHL